MLMQKIKIIVPNEVEEVYYSKNKEDDFIKFNNNELNKSKRKIIIYKTYDPHCIENNFFHLYLAHKDYEFVTFEYYLCTSFENYISKMEYEISFNKLNMDFEFTVNGVCIAKNKLL